jgi:hypothetical protein
VVSLKRRLFTVSKSGVMRRDSNIRPIGAPLAVAYTIWRISGFAGMPGYDKSDLTCEY